MQSVRCEACERDVVPTRGPWGWKVVHVLVWIGCLAIGPWCALLVPLNIVLIPFFLFASIGAISSTAQRAFPDPRCPSCEKVIVAPRAVRDLERDAARSSVRWHAT